MRCVTDPAGGAGTLVRKGLPCRDMGDCGVATLDDDDGSRMSSCGALALTPALKLHAFREQRPSHSPVRARAPCASIPA